MIQKTYKLASIEEMPDICTRIHDQSVYRTASCKVLLAWAPLWDADDFAAFRQKVTDLFPDFTTIGSNFHSLTDILNVATGEAIEEAGCLLTFLFFENSGAFLCGIKAGHREEDRQGRQLLEFIQKTPDPRGVYLVPSDYYNSTEDVLRELKDLKNVPVFGVKTSLYPGYSNFGYNAGEELSVNKLFALIFSGKSLSLRVRYNLGWTPVGKVMKVTKEENPFLVDEIDGQDASYVYNRYLGLRNDQIIPQNLSEFPLIIDRGGVKMSRIGVTGGKEGQLVFGAPVYLNEKISLSYGNPDDLFEEIARDAEELAGFNPEAGLLIVCSNRVMLLKDREPEEIDLYRRHIQSVAHVYGYGEIFYLDGKGGELNSALVSVSFRENTGTSSARHEAADEDYPSASPEVSDQRSSLLVPFNERLSRMFKEMSGDLIQAVKDEAAANRAKSLFYSTVSHELRTPLNSIMGMNELILKESDKQTVTEYSENIKSSGKLMLQLIGDILDTEKLEAGKMEIVPVDYNVRTIMDELARMIEVSARDKGLSFTYHPDENLPDVLTGDEKRIRQCILNLLSNAVKYTQSGEVTFTVSTKDADSDHVNLSVSVKDTGMGIKPEDIGKLTIPFERVDNSKNYRIEGTGLGLNIVNNLLFLMNSKLEIESVYGKGSTFSFSIIQERPHTKDPAASSGKDTVSGRDWGSLSAPGASILVVDDVLMNLRLMHLFLKDSLIDIDTAQNGTLAIQMAENKKYDIIFLDKRMPDTDGVEIFRKIREDKSGTNANTVFIMLTAEEGSDICQKALSEGFSDYMPKPFSPQSLEEILRRHLLPEKIKMNG